MNAETAIQNEIIIKINELGHRLWRANAGTAYTRNGAVIKLMPKGFPDTFGFHKDTGQIVFMEVKTETGRLSESQKRFREWAQTQPVIYGVVRSVEEAVNLMEGADG